MNWQKEYIKILLKKFDLLKSINNKIITINENIDLIINELNNINDIKQFVLKVYVVKKTVKSMTFHLVARTDKCIQLDILNNNSKNKKIDINFKYIDEEEYESLDYKSIKASTFGYNIWKHSVKDNLLQDFVNKIEWTADTEELLGDLELINNKDILNDRTIICISNIYNNSYKLYDYDEKEYLINFENDDKIYHMYYIYDDCSAGECYTDIKMTEYETIEEFVRTVPECIFMKYYGNSDSLIYDNFNYVVNLDYVFELFCK